MAKRKPSPLFRAEARRTYLFVIMISRSPGKALMKKARFEHATLPDMVKEAKNQNLSFLGSIKSPTMMLWLEGSERGGRAAFYQQLENDDAAEKSKEAVPAHAGANHGSSQSVRHVDVSRSLPHSRRCSLERQSDDSQETPAHLHRLSSRRAR